MGVSVNWKALAWGLVGVLVGLSVVAASWMIGVTFLRAEHGQAAYDCLNSPKCVDTVLHPPAAGK